MTETDQIKYTKIETQIYFIDGEVMKLTHILVDECFDDIKELVKQKDVGNIRIELF